MVVTLFQFHRLLSSCFLRPQCSPPTPPPPPHSKAQLCLIMDEVDGMSAGDRGGVADLIQVGAVCGCLGGGGEEVCLPLD